MVSSPIPNHTPVEVINIDGNVVFLGKVSAFLPAPIPRYEIAHHESGMDNPVSIAADCVRRIANPNPATRTRS